MSVWNQIWHVAKKDVRRLRWLLAAQVGVIALAALAAFDPRVHSGQQTMLVGVPDVGGGWSVAVVIMSVFLTVVVVQADSPSRSDAFWASRPLHPIAVLLAKVATLVAFLLVLPGLAEALVLRGHAVSAAEMVPMLRDGLLVQISIIVAAATLAALTRDVATCLAAGVGGGAAVVVVTGLVTRVFDGAYRFLTMTELAIPLVLLGTGVLAYQYSSRNLRRSVVTTVVGSVIGLVLLGAISVPGTVSAVATAPPELISTDVVWGPFDVEPLPRRNAGQAQTWGLRTTIALNAADPRYEYALIAGATRLELADGSVVRGRVRSSPLTTNADGTVRASSVVPIGPRGPEPMGYDWLIQATDAQAGPERLVVVHLSQAQLDLLAAQGGRLELVDGRVDVMRSRAFGSLPLSSGAGIEEDGWGARVLSVGSAGTSGPLVELYTEEAHAYDAGHWTRNNDYMKYAFVSRATGEGVIAPVVRRPAVRHSSILTGGWFTRAARLQIETPKVMVDGSLVPSRSSEWFADAELMMIEVASVGAYPLTATIEDVRLEEEDGSEGR